MGGLEHWLSGLPWGLVLLVVFAVVAAEDAIFAGFLIPGETVLLLGGALASYGHVSVWAVFAVGALAAVLGDTVGFEVGRHLGPRLRTSRLGRHVPEGHWAKADGFMARHGGRSVFLGRWVSFGRALMPALAGATRMPYRTFLAWNAIGGIAWAAAVTAVGYVAGGSWQRLGAVFGRAVLLVVLVLLLLTAVTATARWVIRHPDRVRQRAARVVDWPPMRRTVMRYRHQVDWLGDRFRPGPAAGLALTVGVLTLLLLGWAFGVVIQDVLGHDGTVIADRPVTDWLTTHHNPAVTDIARVVSDLTGLIATLLLAILGGIYAAHRSRHRGALALALASWAGAVGIGWVVAAVVARHAPPGPLAPLQAPGSFPNLPAAAAMAVTAVLLVLIARLSLSWRWKVTAGAGALVYVALGGLAHLYLATAWTSDILAGWLLGALWAAVLMTAWWLVRSGLVGGAAPEGRPSHPAARGPGRPEAA